MESNEFSKPSKKELNPALKVIIGALGGACISGLMLYLGALGIPLTLLMFQAMIVGAVVYGYGGIYSAAVMAAVAEAGIYSIAGPVGSVLMLTIFSLPYAALVFCCEKRMPFFRIMGITVSALGAGVLAALVIVVSVYGSDIGKLMSGMMSASFDSLGEEGRRAIADVYANLYASLGVALDTSDPAALLNDIARSMEDSVKISMPFMLIAIVVENAAFGTLIACFIRVKNGVEGAEYMPVSKWRLPARITIGVILFLIAGYILSNTSGAQGEVVWVTALGTMFIACFAQTMASIYDKLSGIGMRFGFRILWIILILISFRYLPVIYGFGSAMWGRKGLLRQLRAHWHGDGDNTQQ